MHTCSSSHLYVPASPILIASFLATLANLFSNKTIQNYIYGLCAWHILHNSLWAMNKDELKTMLKAAEKLTPESLQRMKCCPYMPKFITAVKHKLDLDTPLDAAVFACLTTCFYTTACLGEFTVCWLDAFNPTLHITPANLSHTSN